ncbi:class I SAM-dependent DNA methyltransferase [Pseudonocardia endophytica]|uniref:Methyltransferase family protein n=1 Tax=Pseudonocardia endophytica TaxID=401976 RepID=A0A4R1HCT3_PSEEN|nr:class I SAM-dependent methyltransferase [Pseudonocardia endophytica]TCK19834.1 methyltransferase family protein [Pseudonocardia endophytica]
MATNTGGNPHLERAYALNGPDDVRELYDEWATTYDEELGGEEQGYVAPARAADAVAAAAGVDGEILDAGCGTGLTGVELVRRGATVVDGLDLSEGMLERARATGAYRTLATADLTQPIDAPDGRYDVVVCVGTLTHGHVGPAVLGEFARVTKPGGVVVATVLDDIWEPGGYRAEVDRLAAGDVVEAVSTDVTPYRAGQGVDCRMVVLRVR